METIYLVLYIFAGVCFGLAAGRVATAKVDFLSLGLLTWLLVPLLQHINKAS